jgi:uncharacterized membrane protein
MRGSWVGGNRQQITAYTFIATLVLLLLLFWYGNQVNVQSGGACSINQWSYQCWGSLAQGCWFNTSPACAGGQPFPAPGFLILPLGFLLIFSGLSVFLPGKQGRSKR